MANQPDTLRDWHRLFGLLLTGFFTNSPFIVEVERDLSQQQQFLDVVIVRRGRGKLTLALPDGLNDLLAHNLITFKSHHEALDDWAMKELIGHYVAYRKLVSPSPSELLPEDQFRLHAVCARFPDQLSARVPWQELRGGVYDCQWGTDAVRVIVAGQLPRAAHNAPLHLFSASPELVGFGQTTYQQHSARTSLLLRQLFERFRSEGYSMSYTMNDFIRDTLKKEIQNLSLEEQMAVVEALPPEKQQALLQALPPEKQQAILQALPPEKQQVILQELLQALPPEKRLAGLSAKQIRQYLDQLTAEETSTPRKPPRKK